MKFSGKVWSDHETTWLHLWSFPRNRTMPRCATRGRGLLCFRTTACFVIFCFSQVRQPISCLVVDLLSVRQTICVSCLIVCPTGRRAALGWQTDRQTDTPGLTVEHCVGKCGTGSMASWVVSRPSAPQTDYPAAAASSKNWRWYDWYRSIELCLNIIDLVLTRKSF